MCERLERAQSIARSGRLEAAYEEYVGFFFSRLNGDIKKKREFYAFFRYQIATYLLLKSNTIITLAEGDMISDLIEDVYISFLDDIKSSYIKVGEKGRLNLLSALRVPFPCVEDDRDELSFSNAVSK